MIGVAKAIHMQNSIRAILAMGLLSGTLAANAATVNFNMTALSPSPTYGSAILDLNLGAFLGSGSVGCQVFAGLDLTGSSVGGCATAIAMTLTNAGLLDGIFSKSWSQNAFVQDGLPFVVGVENGIQTAKLFADGTVEGGWFLNRPLSHGAAFCWPASAGDARSLRSRRLNPFPPSSPGHAPGLDGRTVRRRATQAAARYPRGMAASSRFV